VLQAWQCNHMPHLSSRNNSVRNRDWKVAPRAGFEPATNRLTDNFDAVSGGNLPVRRVTQLCGYPCA
jgi:hypothetical protein